MLTQTKKKNTSYILHPPLTYLAIIIAAKDDSLLIGTIHSKQVMNENLGAQSTITPPHPIPTKHLAIWMRMNVARSFLLPSIVILVVAFFQNDVEQPKGTSDFPVMPICSNPTSHAIHNQISSNYNRHSLTLTKDLSKSGTPIWSWASPNFTS